MADHDKILSAARDRMALCADAESANRQNALDDLKFLAGEQWPQEAARQRAVEGRPCITINKLPSFLRQVTNDQRQNTPSIKIHPVDGNADVETAEVIQGMVRHIEYESNADVAYDTAVNSAAACGIGFFRLVTEYEAENSFNQVIRFRRERNALNVYLDPFSVQPDGSDARFAFITDSMPKDEFNRKYPKATAGDGLSLAAIGDSANYWMPDGRIAVVEYYWIEDEEATLVMLSNGETAYRDELDAEALNEAGVVIVAERPSTRRRVRWAKITGCDVLAEADIPCRWIPVFPVTGEEIDVGGKVTRKGMVRDAKDPSQMYNYWVTSATEEVALRPKVPFIGAVGQFKSDRRWLTANNRSYPFLEYDPVDVGGQLAPPPQRAPMADMPIGALQMLAHAADDIKATTGIHDASLGAGGNETSGRAIMARQREGDLSNFHFTDNLNRAVRHAGRCIIDMIPRIYDTPRVVRILGEDEKLGHAEINQPVQDQSEGIERVLHDVTIGKYDVTVSAGPSYTTQRQEAIDGMSQLAQAYPPLMSAAGDLVVKNFDWPGAEEIAERIKRTIPPQVIGDENEGLPQLPPQVQQQMQQMDQVIQQMGQELEHARSGLAKAQIDAQSRVEVARINAQSRQDVEELKGMVQMLLQRMQPPAPLTAAAYRTGTQEVPPAAPPPNQSPTPQRPPQAGVSLSGVPEFAPAQPDAQGLDIAPQGIEQLPAAELTGQGYAP
ncbi:portal protein [Kerstersia gyiorum]|uniref:portal protein n=1 Tax=Kerstersia gyiorum TaxID=206506 RepID=UPI00209F5076|nr:portal protein [Kerstersia gyiorum]MCP1679419.1 chaperonin cofactor prefoldin [Kerstersia gyiorum]MCP1823922.1 chaperonin cofactor prefoldin [Kerstersia gyiorum]MCP1827363.1 chaperonin cofactor prefoldin [Kerstersia gyiorum]MCW2448988.1 chaperonin cofactor prefoldin [Kerstersia gyiorum]